MNFQIFFLLFTSFYWLMSCGVDEQVDESPRSAAKSGPTYLVGLPSSTLLHLSGNTEVELSYALNPLSTLSASSSSPHLAYLQFAADTPQAKISAFLQEAQEAEELLFAEPNTTYELYVSADGGAEGVFKGFNLRDQLYQQYEAPWWIKQIKMPPLLSTLARQESQLLLGESLAKSSPIIAVIDSGSDISHRALMKRVFRNPLAGKAGCSNDSWGCDTTRGEGQSLGIGPALPFLTSSFGEHCPKAVTRAQMQRRSACLHGTHVAGLIVGDPEHGVDGICPSCRIFPVKVVEEVDGQGRVTDLSFLRALQYIRNLNQLLEEKIKIVNFSFGKFQWSVAVAQIIAQMRREGVLFIAAAGNENVNEKVFPAALPGVIAVTAVDKQGRKSAYANYGSWVAIAAPGGDIENNERQGLLSAAPGGEYYFSQGTSVASPVVAAVAGLLLSLSPSMSSEVLRERLLSSADRRLYDADFALGYNERYYKYDREGRGMPLLGAGLVDVDAAWHYQPTGQANRGEETPKRPPPSCGSLGFGPYPPAGPTARGMALVFFLVPVLGLGLSMLLTRSVRERKRKNA